jgi:hypothetical protein
MFLLGKRNFSLRDSPSNNVSSLSPRFRLQSDSPAKRLKFGDGNPLLSSTLLNETKIVEESKTGPTKNEKDQEFERSSLLIPEKTLLDQTTTCAKVSVVETPPPTPDVNVISKFEILTKQKISLQKEQERLDKRIDELIQQIDDCQKDIDSMRAAKFKYDDYCTMITRGQNQIRDHLNNIFKPGNELGQRFEPMMQEQWSKQTRKLEKKCLEWNCQLDQARNLITKRMEDLNHEMELHQRTLLHQEHLKKAQENETVESEEVVKEGKIEEGEISVESANICVDGQDTEDCVIIDHVDEERNHQEEGVANQQAELSEAKQESDDDTDVEVNSEEPGSFTPCQAQRPEK